MERETINALVATATTLAEIQLEGVEDKTGFSNADKLVGAFLASAVQMDPTDEDNARTLAALVCKYRRQSEGMVGVDMHARFKALAKDTKITTADRDRARTIVLAKPSVHPKYGAQVTFQWNGFNSDYADAIKSNGGKCIGKDPGGAWLWAVSAVAAPKAVARFQDAGATILGSYEVPDTLMVEEGPRTNPMVIAVEKIGEELALSWAYGNHQRWNQVAKSLPKRRFDWGTKKWLVPMEHLAIAEDAFAQAGADTDGFKPFAANAPTMQQLNPDEPDYFARVPKEIVAKLKPYQVDGVKWLLRPLREIRTVLRSPEVKGEILGDDMGLGKTFQTIVAANAVAEENERILVVCPASLKLNWMKEIHKWVGADADICIGEGSYVEPARWMIVNYDILPKMHETLEKIGYAVLILDEAHYIKNRDSGRAKMVVGGLTAVKNEPSKMDPRKRKRAKVKGYTAHATKRVYALTGTPMTNRPRDLFNLLKAVGHPLGRNFMAFGQRYCDPQFNGFGTTYNGGSNLAELRERIAPIFLQRKKTDHLNLPPKMRAWTPVEVDLTEYLRVMNDYDARRAAGELSRTEHHLALLTEARVCGAIAKIPRTIELASNCVEQGEKVLVFTNRTEVVDRVMEHFGDAAVKIDGTCSKTQRAESERAFMEDDSVRVIVGNLIAMGTGLNLTAGTQVIVNDLDWVPANHLQAEDRAYRIGQEKMVNVTYVLAAGTFDEELAVLLEEKFGLVNEFEDYDRTPLFDRLVERLANQAPRNEGVKRLQDARKARKTLRDAAQRVRVAHAFAGAR